MDALERARQEELDRLKNTVKAELEALCAQARAEKKWLFCSYQEIWFSPDELQEQNAKGKFLWGAKNWTLLDPYEKVNRLKVAAVFAQRELDEFRYKIDKWEEAERERQK